MQQKIQNILGGLPDQLMRAAFLLEGKNNSQSSDDYLAELDFYLQDDLQKENGFFKLPDSPPLMEAQGNKKYSDGKQTLYKYESRYIPANSSITPRYRCHTKNMDGYLLTWQHPRNTTEKKPPLVLCVHGFHMGQPQRAKAMFKIRKLYSMGMDVALFIQPHHWRRAEGPFKQYFINAEDAALTIETFGQAIHDLHSCYLYLKNQGYDRIGLIGGSLGGCLVSLYASLTDDPTFIFSVVPAIRFDHYLDPRKGRFRFPVTKLHAKKAFTALNVVDPSHYTPKMSIDKIGVVYHQGDKINEAKDTKSWVKKWGITNCTSITGGHWVAFDSKARGQAWYGWLKDFNFISSE